MSAAKEAKILRAEAVERLNSMFGIPEGYGSGDVERIVECIVLEIVAIQAACLPKEKEE